MAARFAFVFGLRGSALGNFASAAGPQASSTQMQAYWTNFAKTGDPNGPGLPDWPTFDGSQHTLVIDDTTQAVADFRKAQLGVMTARWGQRVGMTAP